MDVVATGGLLFVVGNAFVVKNSRIRPAIESILQYSQIFEGIYYDTRAVNGKVDSEVYRRNRYLPYVIPALLAGSVRRSGPLKRASDSTSIVDMLKLKTGSR
jgi:hypothetical protein